MSEIFSKTELSWRKVAFIRRRKLVSAAEQKRVLIQERLSEELEAAGLEIKKQFGDLKGTPFSDGDEMAFVIGHK